MLNFFKPAAPTRVEVQGQAVLVRPMTAGELTAIYAAEEKGDKWKSAFLMLSLCVLDTQGNKMFPTVEDAMGITQDAANELIGHVQQVNGFGTHDEKKV